MTSTAGSTWVEPTEADVPSTYVFPVRRKALKVASVSSERIMSNQTDNFNRTAELMRNGLLLPPVLSA